MLKGVIHLSVETARNVFLETSFLFFWGGGSFILDRIEDFTNDFPNACSLIGPILSVFFVSNRVPVCLQNRERRLVSRFRKRCHLWEGDLHKQFAYNIGTATTDDPRANQLVRFGPRTLLFLSFSLSLSLSFSCCR